MIGIEALPAVGSHPPTPAPDGNVLTLPPNAPRVAPNRVSRWFGRSLLKLGGWDVLPIFWLIQSRRIWLSQDF